MEPAPGLFGARIGLIFDGERLESMELQPPTAIREAIRLAWGDGAKITVHGSSFVVWRDAKTHMRAVLPDQPNDAVVQMEFAAYLPVDEWMGEGKEVAALRGPVLGQTVDELRTKWGAHFESADPSFASAPLSLKLPAATAPEAYTKADLVVRDGKVVGISFAFPYSSDTERAALHATCERKWGAPTAKPMSLITEYAGPDKQRVQVTDSAGKLEVALSLQP